MWEKKISNSSKPCNWKVECMYCQQIVSCVWVMHLYNLLFSMVDSGEKILRYVSCVQSFSVFCHVSEIRSKGLKLEFLINLPLYYFWVISVQVLKLTVCRWLWSIVDDNMAKQFPCHFVINMWGCSRIKCLQREILA